MKFLKIENAKSKDLVPLLPCSRRKETNQVLKDYGDGYELSENGEIQMLPEKGLRAIFEASIPGDDHANINDRIDAAVSKFRRTKSSISDRRDAIRDLVEILEYLRLQAKEVLTSKDEQDLFNIANNFSIRHHNLKQKNKYDKAIWYSWMFYFYLATIHACMRMIEKNKS